jgi:uncharacterized protein
VQLYVGSTREFVDDAIQHNLGERIGANFYDYYGHRAHFSLLQSWQNSLTAMALQISSARLWDNGIVVEMELPLTSKRLDCMLFGRAADGCANAYLVELKQWQQVKPSDVEDCVLTYMGGSETVALHPSLQALNYAQYLDDANDAYGEGGITIRPSSYLHNMTPAAAKPLRTREFEALLSRAPLFIGADALEFAAAMRAAVGRGDGEAVMKTALSGKNRPSRRLLENTAKMIEGEPRYTLLDEQLIAYKSVMAEVRRGRRTKHDHAVVVVKGGPGTGKSVIALNLVGDLSRMQVDVRHATGSKAFTETLWNVIGKNAMPQFRYFNSFQHAEEGAIDVLVCDEAHRIRQTSNDRYTRKDRRSELSQIEELVRAAKVTVFFLDDDQAVRPVEIGSTDLIREAAVAMDARYRQIDLRAQFRCAGSETYLEWVDQLLEIRKTARIYLPPDEPFEFEIVDSPAELDRRIRAKLSQGQSARLVAGFCWPWSEPKADGTLVDDIVIDGFHRPWNAKPGAKKLAPGIPPASLWAWNDGGVNQVGCIYTAQGFEFDYAGLIFGKDLVIRDGVWVPQPAVSHDRGIKQKSNARFLDCVKNVYRVLLTRGLKGCYVTFLDDETRRYVEQRIG